MLNSLKYLAAYTIPMVAAWGLFMEGAWLFATPVYAFVLIPLFEILLPEDPLNPSESQKKSRNASKIYDWMLYVNLPLVYGLLFFGLIKASSGSLETYEIAGLIFSVGIVLGVNGINVGHELGHRNKPFERLLGKWLLVPPLYSHFYIEHNYGHHLHVATPEDPATARLNQTVYHFWWTSISRQYLNAWRIQWSLLKRDQKSFWSLSNHMFWSTLLQVGYLFLVASLFGLPGLGVALGAAVVGMLLLETVNYIEHYGLMRKRLPSGRYERVAPIHSWNSNHVMGRIVLYELTRHSDHHYKSAKKYQVLEYRDQAPAMPFGYPTSMVLSLVPPLWFRIMNRRIPGEMRSVQSSLVT